MEGDSIDPLARGICWKPAAASDFGDMLAFDNWSALGKTYLAHTLKKNFIGFRGILISSLDSNI